MRFAITFSFVTLLAVPAFGQGSTTASNPYGLDPYNPTDASWLRSYGAALVAQTPLLDLTALDTYKPSDLSLVRQIGGAIPLCCPEWGWFGPSFGPLTVQGLAPLSRAHGSMPPRVDVSVVSMPPPASAAPVAAASPAQGAVATPAQGPTVASTFLRPTTNDGVWLRYEGRTWVSAGRAVPLQASERERVGEYAGRPVYRLTRGSRDVIYVPAREGMFTPYRLKQ